MHEGDVLGLVMDAQGIFGTLRPVIDDESRHSFLSDD